jgi:hypothetical protein
MEKATSKIRNFLWSGTAIQTKARVAWRTCCMQREDGGLNMIKPQEALLALMAKWIVSALESGLSNFRNLIRYKLMHFQP